MIVVSGAEPGDAADIADLMQEMDLFYGEQARETSASKVASISSVLFPDEPSVWALLAWDETLLVGLASYSFLWPAVMSTQSLYLKELYVRQDYRQSGVGTLLMANLSGIAIESGCSRLEWTTDQSNRDAQAFYERLGVSPDPSKLFYRAEEDTLRTIASSPGVAHGAAS